MLNIRSIITFVGVALLSALALRPGNETLTLAVKLTWALFAAVFVLAALIALLRMHTPRIKRAWAMIIQVYAGTDTSRRQPAVCYSGIVANQPVLIGKTTGSVNPLPCVALDTAADVANGTPTFLFGGSFSLTVTAKSSLSPSTGATINPGDPIFADGGTLDSASNMTYGFTLDANSSGIFFGRLDPSSAPLLSGTTATVTVLLDKGM